LEPLDWDYPKFWPSLLCNSCPATTVPLEERALLDSAIYSSSFSLGALTAWSGGVEVTELETEVDFSVIADFTLLTLLALP
jgi:hypothetical protein